MAGTTETQPAGPEPRPWWKVAPYDRVSLAWFLAAFIAIAAFFTLTGLAYVEWVEPTSIGESEVEISKDFEDIRTDSRNDLALAGSVPSNTPVKIGLMIVMLVVLPVIWKRWHDWAFLAGALLLEVSVYGLSSFLVGRPRPPVERLASAPTESWPSGHVAASVTFYFGMALIIGWHTRHPIIRWTAFIVAAVITVTMAISRLYLGMHYVSDVVAGVALGAASLAVAHRLIHARALRATHNGPQQTHEIDLTPEPDLDVRR